MKPYNKPLPVIDPVVKGYWDLARMHQLSVQHCSDCGDRHFPPTDVCPKCLSDKQKWEVVSGRGTLVSWVSFHRAYWDGHRDDLPYDVCLVKLDEGPLVISNFATGIPEGAKMGMPMQVVFEDVTAEVSLPRFAAA